MDGLEVKIPSFEMDDDWGYHDFRKPPYGPPSQKNGILSEIAKQLMTILQHENHWFPLVIHEFFRTGNIQQAW